MAQQKEYKLDVFHVLGQIDKKNSLFYDGLTEEERKAFVPYVTMRWLTGNNSDRQIVYINELVNPFMFPLGQHKDLLYKLMTICTTGKQQRYGWKKTLSKKTNSTPTAVGVIRDYYGYNTIDATNALKLLSTDYVLELAGFLGRQKDEISKIKTELKNR